MFKENMKLVKHDFGLLFCVEHSISLALASLVASSRCVSVFQGLFSSTSSSVDALQSADETWTKTWFFSLEENFTDLINSEITTLLMNFIPSAVLCDCFAQANENQAFCNKGALYSVYKETRVLTVQNQSCHY